MKKILYIFVLTLFFLSCSKQEDEVTDIVKQDFIVQTKKISDFTGSLLLQKTWKLSSSQDIKLNSLAAWRVKSIYVKEWENVWVNDVIARLDDSISNFWLALERAQNNLDKAHITFESTELTLDKQLFDTQSQVDKLNLSIENLKKDSQKNIEKAQSDLTNSIYSNAWSKSSLDLDKLDNSIKKQELDLDNKKIADDETISSYSNTLKKDFSTLSVFLDDILEFSDKLLWMSPENRDKNDNFEKFLWAKDATQKINAEKYYNELLSYNITELSNLNFENLSEEQINQRIELITKWYEKSDSLLSALEQTLNNSLVSIWSLSQSDISGYLANVNQYQSTYLINYNSTISFKNSLNNFFRTYLLNQNSIQKQIDLLKQDREILVKSFEIWEKNNQIWYDKVVLNSDSTLDSLNLDFKSALNNLEIAKKNKEITLKNLQNSINDAEISYKQALENIDKLAIKSPIDGTIWSISIDVWQEVTAWKELFSIFNNNSNEVIISFSKDELSNVWVWDTAYVKLDNVTYTWSVYSISNSADTNLKYISVIKFPDWVNFIGDVVNVSIPFKVEKNTLPLNILKVDNFWKWIINVMIEWKIEQKMVNIWKVFWDNIEILDNLDSELLIITTNIENFDNTKFDLKIEQ